MQAAASPASDRDGIKVQAVHDFIPGNGVMKPNSTLTVQSMLTDMFGDTLPPFNPKQRETASCVLIEQNTAVSVL